MMNAPARVDPIDILLVEDEPGDVLLIEEAFADGELSNRLHVVSDGVEALAFLRQPGEYVDAPRPGLVLLDLNLARKDGREVLGEVKGDEALLHIPVIMLTTSSAEADVLRSYKLARERVRDEARRLRALHRGRAPDRRVLRHGGAAPPSLSLRSRLPRAISVPRASRRWFQNRRKCSSQVSTSWSGAVSRA